MTTMTLPPAAAIERLRTFEREQAEAEKLRQDAQEAKAALRRRCDELLAEIARGPEADQEREALGPLYAANNDKRAAVLYECDRTAHELNELHDHWTRIRSRAKHDAPRELRQIVAQLYPDRQQAVTALAARLADAQTMAARLRQQAADKDTEAEVIETGANTFGIEAGQRKQIKSCRADAERLRDEAKQVDAALVELRRQLAEADAKLLEP